MRKAFTLIELLVVVAIMIALGGVVLANYAGRKSNDDLISTSQQIATILRQAQSDAMTQESSSIWGVYFSNATSATPFYAIFYGSYTTATVSAYYQLPSTVAYQTSTLASGATTSVTFSQISGFPSASTSIGLYMPKQKINFMDTIYIASSGNITY